MRDDGGSVFQQVDRCGPSNAGMTLRQWYKGMLSSQLKPIEYVRIENSGLTYMDWARRLGRYSDALIAEDEEGEKHDCK